MIIEKWKNAQSCVVGKYHIQKSLPCQDKAFFLESGGVTSVALADGAGSKAYSEVGAEAVSKAVCELLSARFDEFLMYFEYEFTDKKRHAKNMKELARIILAELVAELKKIGGERNVPVAELSSTLLFFAVKGDYYLMGHIGDGMIGGVFQEVERLAPRELSGPENGAASNITFFVPDSDAVDHLRLDCGRADNLKGVLLTSDGAADVLFKKEEIDANVVRLFENFKSRTTGSYNQVLSSFLTNIISGFSSDDLSLNILYLEQFDTTGKCEDNYDEFLLSNVKSSRQIVQKSQYCSFLDPSIPAPPEFVNLAEVKEYLKWR